MSPLRTSALIAGATAIGALLQAQPAGSAVIINEVHFDPSSAVDQRGHANNDGTAHHTHDEFVQILTTSPSHQHPPGSRHDGESVRFAGSRGDGSFPKSKNRSAQLRVDAGGERNMSHRPHIMAQLGGGEAQHIAGSGRNPDVEVPQSFPG